MTNEKVVHSSTIDGKEDIIYINDDMSHDAIKKHVFFNPDRCPCKRHTEKLIERKHPEQNTTSNNAVTIPDAQNNVILALDNKPFKLGGTYNSCEICFYGINDVTAVIKENTTKFKCPAGNCEAHQSFRDFIEGKCCEDAQRKLEYDRRVDVGIFQRDFEKIMEVENNLRKDLKEAKETRKRTREEAERAIQADKDAEKVVKSLEESLPKIREEADAKRSKLDAALFSTCKKIASAKSAKLMPQIKQEATLQIRDKSRHPFG